MSRFPQLLTGLFREFRNSYNEGIKKAEIDLDKALKDSTDAISKSTNAEDKANLVQTQLDQVTKASTIDPAVEQIAVDTEGVIHDSPDARLRSDYNKVTSKLAQRPTQKQVASISSGGLADKIATVADFTSGEVVIAVASDSTANDGNDWVFSWLRLLASTLPANVGVKHVPWDTTNQVWKSASVIKEGATIPASGGVAMDDTFTRTGEAVGSTSDNGKVWTGVAGTWTMDGDSVSSNGSGALSYDVGSKSAKATIEIDVVTASTSTVGGRFYVGVPTSGVPNTGVWGSFSVSSAGIPNFSLLKTINGVNTTLASADYSLPLTTNSSTPQKVTITLEVSIQQVTVKLVTSTGEKNYTGTITESDYAALGNYVTLTGFHGSNYSILSAKYETAYTPEQYTGITVYNGAVAGTKLDYQQTRINTMFPSSMEFDGLLVAGGHNYGTDSPDTFLTAFDGFVQSFLTNHPNAITAVSSQNPQFSPSTTITAHAKRQAAVRSYAKKKMYDYIPAFEAFNGQSDGGASLVLPDGIHPTTPPIGTTPDGYGAVLWAKCWQNIVDLHRVI